MKTAVPKRIKEQHEITGPVYNTLLIDGSNILKLSQKDQTISSNGKPTGGIFQFLLQIKMMLQKYSFTHVYVMWDGERSGQLRYNLYTDYKANRDDKHFNEEGLSDYMKQFNAIMQRRMDWVRKKQDPAKLAEKNKEKEIFYWQRDILIESLEELYIRQLMCDEVEADDFIAYYVKNRQPNERIVIMSTDRDLSQLISENVILYMQDKKKFINIKNHKEEMGYDYHNVALKKIICGDASDNIKGIKGVGEITLFKNIPELVDRECTLEEVISHAKQINDDRIQNKKKPLKWAENIVNRVTEGIQGENIYEINKAIIDLKNPLMSDEGKELLKSISYQPLSTDRSFENLYKILYNVGIDEFRNETRFSNFFADFQSLIDREKKFSENS